MQTVPTSIIDAWVTRGGKNVKFSPVAGNFITGYVFEDLQCVCDEFLSIQVRLRSNIVSSKLFVTGLQNTSKFPLKT